MFYILIYIFEFTVTYSLEREYEKYVMTHGIF